MPPAHDRITGLVVAAVAVQMILGGLGMGFKALQFPGLDRPTRPADMLRGVFWSCCMRAARFPAPS